MRQLLCIQLSLLVQDRCQHSYMCYVIGFVYTFTLKDVSTLEIVRFYLQFLSFIDSWYSQITAIKSLAKSDTVLRINSIIFAPILTVCLHIYLYFHRSILPSLLVQTLMTQ